MTHPEPGKRSRRNSTQRRKIAQAIFTKYNYTCVYCGAENPDDLSIDHLFPIAKGGKDVRANMVACCRSCNTIKEDMTVLEWIASGTAPKEVAAFVNTRLFLDCR
jgi:5-methylcytosine-specific restriction protein A